MTGATSVPILFFLGLSVLDLGPMYATDRQTYVRQTDVKQHHRYYATPIRGGGIINDNYLRLGGCVFIGDSLLAGLCKNYTQLIFTNSVEREK